MTLNLYTKYEQRFQRTGRLNSSRGGRSTGRLTRIRGSVQGPRRLERLDTRDERAPTRINRRKLKVSNLPFKVNNQEIYDLFSQFGPLAVCKIQYDNLGRSNVYSK